jgi:3-oxoacyl-[acyl-carrier-protein] synthase-1
MSTGREIADTDVLLVGIGAATAVGTTAPATAAAVRAGIAGFSEHPWMVDMNGEPFVVAAAPYLDAGLSVEARLAQLARRAAAEALQAIGSSTARFQRELPAFVGLPELRPGNHAESANEVESQLRTLLAHGGAVGELALLHNGHAAGLMAIELAASRIGSGDFEIALAGGVDSYLDDDTLGWVEDCEQLHNSLNAGGFIPGEAAGFCLLCSGRIAREQQLRCLGRVAAVATARESKRIKTEAVCVGEGLTAAFKQVLSQLPSAETRIDQVLCDQNGEPYRADEFGFTIIRTNEHFVDATDFLAPADCWGDVGAASGPLLFGLAAEAARKGYAKGKNTLVWTSSEGGERTAAILVAEVQRKGAAPWV